MMKKYFYLMAMVIAVLTISSCKDDDNGIMAEVVIPETTNLMQLERYSYELPFEIKSDSEWKIEFDFEEGQICYALPDHGTGTQTVRLCVIDNPLEKRRSGEMFIDFPQDESKSQVIKLQQKSVAEDGENAVDLSLGNRVYVVGYGYNTLSERASANSVAMTPIIEIAKANDDGRIVVGPMDASFVAKTYSGSSVSELSNELSADAKFGGKYLGFKGEVGATFGMKDFSKQENEYAISYVEADMQSAHMEMSTTEIINTYMTDAAYDDINGLPTPGRRHSVPTAYPSTEEGFAKLVQAYGTHLVMSARLGGCMKYITKVDISKVEGSYDLKAYANCSYKNTFVQASMSVSDTYKNSHSNNSKAVETTVKVQGGSKDAAVKLAAANGDNDTNFKAWIESLKDVKNQTLVGLDNATLIPLYELVDQSLTEAEDGVDGVDRYNKLKAYINGDKIEEDMSKALNMEYEMGDATHLPSIPDFASESSLYTGSLIKDYYRGGQAVARICHEYIPVIDKTQRVRVIYPIVSNKVKYNLGYFTGDATHRPAKVCWSTEGLSVVSLEEKPMGTITHLYVRGSSFSDSTGDEIVDATLKDVKAAAPGEHGSYNYALVKIFDKIWMRENYRATRKEDGDKFGNNYNLEPLCSGRDGVYCAFYNEEMVTATAGRYHFAPTGWRVPIASDFLDIEATMKANGVSGSSAKAFYRDKDGGFLGFNMVFVGSRYRSNPDVAYNVGSTTYPVLKDGKWDGFINFDKDTESFGQHWWTWGDDASLPIRLVQDIY